MDSNDLGITRPILHVIGAGQWQIPTIRRAQSMGCRVLVSDGYAERPGYAVADLHAQADITDPEATLAVSRRFGVQGVLCDTTDNGVVTAAHVAQSLGLPGIGMAAARNCTDKSRMTVCAAAAHLPVPQSRLIEHENGLEETLRTMDLPLVFKPVDNQSGRGVTVVRDAEGIHLAYTAARAQSRCGQVLVQAFIEGVEIIVDALVDDGHALLLGVAVKQPYRDNPTISSRICYGLPLPALESDITDAHQTLVGALGVRQGIVHAEYIVSFGRIIPIDFAARGGGVMIYPRVLSHVSAHDVMGSVIRQALGCRPAFDPPPARRAAVIDFLRLSPGPVEQIEGIAEARLIPGVAEVCFNVKPGETLASLEHKDHRLGFLVVLTEDVEKAGQIAEQARQCIRIRRYGQWLTAH